MSVTLKPVPLTPERFSPFGDVIAASATSEAMNDARFDRFGPLATVDIDADGDVAVSIVRSRTPTVLPYRFDMVERHPLGSQAFIPLAPFPFVVVVAEPRESVSPEDLRAFITNGSQGVNYHRGTWHMPLIASAEGLEFLVIDRAPGEGNCEEWVFEEPVFLDEDA